MKRTILSSILPSLAITLVTIFVGGCLAETEEGLLMNEEDQSGQAAAALVGEDSAEVGADEALVGEARDELVVQPLKSGNDGAPQVHTMTCAECCGYLQPQSCSRFCDCRPSAPGDPSTN